MMSNKENTKRKGWHIRVIGLALLAIALIVGGFFGVRAINRAAGGTFTGSRVCNPDSYTADFEVLNLVDTHTLTLKAGVELAVSFEITRGQADLLITAEDGTELYRGNSIDKADFILGIPADGVYTIQLDGHNARGFVHITPAGGEAK